MSGTGKVSNKPSVAPDLSPKRKEKFNYREVGAAITILIIVVVAAVLLAVGFRNKYEEDLQNATVAAEAAKADFTTKLSTLAAHEKELTEREENLTLREKALATAEADLSHREITFEDEQLAFAAEKEAFNAQQAEVKRLSGLLLNALQEDDEMPEELVEWIDLDGEDAETGPDEILGEVDLDVDETEDSE